MNDFDGKQTRQVLIVTGLSGAGKGSLIRCLEDLGFYCVDNLPIPLITTFLKLAFQAQTNISKVALGVDARANQFLDTFISEIEKIRPETDVLRIVFLNASEATLVKRFQETRRTHPLAKGISLENAIKKEKKLLEPIMNMADMTLDTDIYNIHDLRSWVRDSFATGQKPEILVNLVSFGFKYGVPTDSNLVYDLRFLPNPYFTPELKHLTGKQKEIHDYLFSQPVVNDYWNRLTDFLEYSLQKFHAEGRYLVTISVGCTGGKHRSVAFVEKLSTQSWSNIKFITTHRDIERE